MDYFRIYQEFISDRRRKEGGVLGYSELHHILPRSMGGDDSSSNLIRLTAEDHFFAHLLLAKVYGGEMWYALVAMTMESHGRRLCDRFLRRSRKRFAIAREKAAAVHSGRMKGRFAGDKHPMFGRPCSELAKQRTRERHASGLTPMASAESRKKVSEALKGRKFSPEWREKIAESKRGKPRSSESIEKQRATMTGKKRPPEFGIAISARLRGKKKSAEQIQKMREANIGKRLSDETKAKISKRWAEYGHPKGMLGKSQSEEFKQMMKEFNQQKREYAIKFGVSAKTVTRAMILASI